MIYCHITNGIVDNRAVFAEAMPDDWPDKADWIANEDAQIGWSYADGAFAAPVIPGPTTDELWTALRAQRDNLLAACDYTQLPDAPEANKAAWATYREALRNLPDATSDPANAVWPIPPS